jgi:O-antigen ligase
VTALARPYAGAFVPAPAMPSARGINPLVRGSWYLFVMSIPFELPHSNIPIEVPTMTGALFLLTTVLHASVCYRRVPASLVWFSIYLWTMGISAVVNNIQHGSEAFTLGVWLTQLLLIFWCAANVLRRDEVFRGTLIALAIACAIRAGVQVLGIAQTVIPVWGGGERITAFGQNSNLAAMILATGLVAALALRNATNHGLLWRLLVCWGPAVLIGLALIQTGSRGGVVCGVLGILVLFIAGKARLGTVFLGLLTIVALGVGISRSETLSKRFLSAEEGNLSGRERIYPAAIEMIKERPLMGWGPADNQFELARRIDERRRPSRDMHNLVLEVWTVAGVIGAIPFLIGFGLCLGAAWASRGGPRGALPLALLAAIAPGIISGTWIASKILWLVLAIAVASGQAGTRYVAVVPEEPCAV